MDIFPAYVSKHNLSCEKQAILLLIPNTEGWEYLAAKKLSALLRETTSKHVYEFSFLNLLHSFRIKTNLNYIKKNVKQKKLICNLEDHKISEFNQYQKSDKTSFMQILNV